MRIKTDVAVTVLNRYCDITDGTVKETYPDHIIVDVPDISDHCYYEEGFNADCVYPDYNFKEESE